MADVEYSSRAVEWIEDAEPDAREQVRKKLEQAADFPDHFRYFPIGVRAEAKAVL